MSTPTLALTAALDAAVRAVSVNHPGLENLPIVLVVGASKPRVHGHFAPSSWLHVATEEAAEGEGDKAHEILLSGESLSRGAEATFGTLVHELAHAYANANGIADTSNRGRYHNKKFRKIAEDFGLAIELAPTIGHSVTTVPVATAAQYGAVIEQIHQALTHYRAGGVGAAKTPRKPAQKYVLVCDCPDDGLPVGKKFAEAYVDNMTCNDCHATKEIESA